MREEHDRACFASMESFREPPPGTVGAVHNAENEHADRDEDKDRIPRVAFHGL